MSENRYERAIMYSTKNIIAQSYKEFCEASANKYQMLIDMINSAVDNASGTTDYIKSTNDIVAEYSRYGISRDSIVALNDGTVKLGDLLDQITSATDNEVAKIDHGNMSNLTFDVTIPRLQDSPVVKNIQNLFSELNSTYHAISVEKAVGVAYAIGGTITDMIQNARDVLSAEFTSGFSDFSNTLNDAIDAIRSGMNISQYLVRRFRRSGMEAAADYGQLITSSDDINYSGASIWGAVMWQTTNRYIYDAAVNTWRFIANVGKTMWEGIKKAGTWLVQTVGKWGVETFVNPLDVELINDKGSGTVDVFAMALSSNLSLTDNNMPLVNKLLEGPLKMDFIPCEVIAQIDIAEVSRMVELKKTIAGKFQLILESGSYTYDTSIGILDNCYANGMTTSITTLEDAAKYYVDIPSGYDDMTITDVLNYWFNGNSILPIEYYVKVKPINYEYLACIYNIETVPGRVNMLGDNQFHDIMKYMISCGDYYNLHESKVGNNETEIGTYLDFVTGLVFTYCVFKTLSCEAKGTHDRTMLNLDNLDSMVRTIVNASLAEFPVSNLDFVKVLVDGVVWNNTEYGYRGCIPSGLDLDDILSNLFRYQETHPFNNEYFPYVHSQIQWSDPSYRIVGDAEHQEELANFIVKAAAVIIAVIITVKLYSKLKYKAVRANLEAEGALWNCTEAASLGKLSPELVKIYRKKAYKASLLNFLTGNFLAASGKATSSMIQKMSDGASAPDLSELLYLIRGY